MQRLLSHKTTLPTFAVGFICLMPFLTSVVIVAAQSGHDPKVVVKDRYIECAHPPGLAPMAARCRYVTTPDVP